MITDFHFLRPWWLVALLPALSLVWTIHRRINAASSWKGIIADHLVRYLVQGASSHSSRAMLGILAAGWVLAIIALAGPTCHRAPSPFAQDAAAIAVVIKISPSMQAEDMAPSRLIRSVQKIHDLMAQRGSAKTALIAYAGTAHTVMPATSDAGIVDSFATSLDPEIMPEEGDAATDALRLADVALAAAGGGSILWITDGIAPEQSVEIANWRKSSRNRVLLLAPLAESPELAALTTAAEPAEAKIIRLTPDDGDLTEIESASKFAATPAGDSGVQWEDIGYWLTPLLLVFLLPFFRRGWMSPIAERA